MWFSWFGGVGGGVNGGFGSFGGLSWNFTRGDGRSVGEEGGLNEDGNGGGELVGIGDGDGAVSFVAAFLAGAARIRGVMSFGGGGRVGLASFAGGGFLALVFVFGEPIIFPAEAVEKFFEETAGVDVLRGAHAGDESVDVAFAAGGEFVGGFESLATRTATRDNEAGIDDGADEGNALVDGLAVLLFRVEGEI